MLRYSKAAQLQLRLQNHGLLDEWTFFLDQAAVWLHSAHLETTT